MDIRTLTPSYAVSPQIAPEDVARIKAAGYVAIICNRPDAEVDAEEAAAAIRRVAEAEGIAFVDNPVTNGALSDANVRAQRQVLDETDGAVFAYCRSGTRSTVVWALGEAGRQPVDDIISTAARAGYDIDGLRPQLEALAGG